MKAGEDGQGERRKDGGGTTERGEQRELRRDGSRRKTGERKREKRVREGGDSKGKEEEGKRKERGPEVRVGDEGEESNGSTENEEEGDMANKSRPKEEEEWKRVERD
ncbi:hypothetical protein ACROYT_G028673 [Oculina patagonica]